MVVPDVTSSFDLLKEHAYYEYGFEEFQSVMDFNYKFYHHHNSNDYSIISNSILNNLQSYNHIISRFWPIVLCIILISIVISGYLLGTNTLFNRFTSYTKNRFKINQFNKYNNTNNKKKNLLLDIIQPTTLIKSNFNLYVQDDDDDDVPGLEYDDNDNNQYYNDSTPYNSPNLSKDINLQNFETIDYSFNKSV
ncbi:hypothetical protein WICMUC_000425 [Wickerhamomyces mucosus]|uniref:Uncharacterized protein n=1 Tax=Wickerhamomyces mucosus TaxID=1378264 RepID=A0A9P8PZT4_9ASCO|nr:hypothetical protein WICMUC_000425 [Wickerhamomyces mucosus]